MQLFPEDKKKAAVMGVLAVVGLAGAVWAYSRLSKDSAAPSPQVQAAEQRAEEIQKSMPPPPPPDDQAARDALYPKVTRGAVKPPG